MDSATEIFNKMIAELERDHARAQANVSIIRSQLSSAEEDLREIETVLHSLRVRFAKAMGIQEEAPAEKPFHLRSYISKYIEEHEEFAVKDLTATLRDIRPGTSRHSIQGEIARNVTAGVIENAGYGLYRRKPV